MIAGYETLELSTQMLIKEALLRNIEVDVLDWKENFIRLTYGKQIEYVKQASRTSADTYISPLIMENKQVTKIILSEHGIQVPQGIEVYSLEEAMEQYSQFLGKDIVIKPKSTNHGIGIIILKKTHSEDDFKQAVQHALEYDDAVLIEKFITGKEYRFLIIGHEVVAVLYREPANVKGDGKHTIQELVHEKNKDPLRGEGYVTPLERIQLGEVERDYLLHQNKTIHTIPDQGEQVYLRENSNISTGGDSIDYTDEVRDEYKQIAIQSAQAVGANICGADIIIEDIYAAPNPNSYSVIELNFNPALHMHNFPFKGKNRHVERKVLDLLGF